MGKETKIRFGFRKLLISTMSAYWITVGLRIYQLCLIRNQFVCSETNVCWLWRNIIWSGERNLLWMACSSLLVWSSSIRFVWRMFRPINWTRDCSSGDSQRNWLGAAIADSVTLNNVHPRMWKHSFCSNPYCQKTVQEMIAESSWILQHCSTYDRFRYTSIIAKTWRNASNTPDGEDHLLNGN